MIFIVSTVFALATVPLSCALPRRKAAKVSPVEAARYAEGGEMRRKSRRARGVVSVRSMAWANLSRSRGKTAVTVTSPRSGGGVAEPDGDVYRWFWFYTYHPTVMPILLLLPVFILLGCALPLAAYRAVSRLTIVERLRRADA